MTDNSYSHILKYTGLLGGVQGLNMLVGVVRNKFAALFLGPSGMGLLALFNSTTNFLATATQLGIPTSGVRLVSEANSSDDNFSDANSLVAFHASCSTGSEALSLEESVCLVRSLSFLSALGGAAVCALLCPFIGDLFSPSRGGGDFRDYILLSPTVFFTILAGGEMAVLKGLGRLKALAAQSALLSVLSLLFSVPIYYFWREGGILAVLFLLAFAQWGLGFAYSRRAVGFRLTLSRRALRRAMPMVRLGLSFVVAGMMGAGAELLVRGFLCDRGGLGTVGLFNACTTIVLVYGGMIFSVMDSDYYPRLSAVGGPRLEGRVVALRNSVVSKQVEMNVALVAPIVAGLVLLLPYLVPVLYNRDFMGMLGMAQVASFSLLFRAVYLPVEYIPLSRGDAKVYLAQECCAVVLLVAAEYLGYLLGGLHGMGWGILVAYAVEAAGVLLFSRCYYGLRLSFGGYGRLLRKLLRK